MNWDYKKFFKQYLFYKSRVRNRLAIYFSLLVIAPLVIMGSIAVMTLNSSHTYDVSKLELQLLDNKIGEIEKFLTETLSILELRVGIEGLVEIDLSQQQFLLAGLLEEIPSFEDVSFINLKGRETAKKSRNNDSNPELLDVSQLSYFKTAVSGENYIGRTFYTLSGPRLVLAAPVRNRDQEIIQVLVAEVSLKVIDTLLRGTKLGEQGYVYLVEKDGSLLSHSNLSVGLIGDDLASLPRVSRVLKGETLSGLNSNDRYYSYFDHQPVVGAGKTFSLVDWGIFAEWPLAEADQVVNQIKQQILGFTLLGSIAALIISSILSSNLIRPLRALEQFALEIGKGDFRKRIKIQTHDELEEFANSLNHMAADLEELQKLKDEFVFIAAHELRTPVTAIKGYLSLAMDRFGKQIPAEMNRLLEPVYESNERLIQLVNDLLMIARSEAGRLEIKVEPVAMTQLVTDVIRELDSLTTQQNIKIVYEPAEWPKVLADPGRIKEILVNLIGNAIKYNRPDGTITISHVRNSGGLTTSIRDSGIGISKEDQTHLFEKFFRVESEATQEIPGTGLGLFIVKQLIEKMNGTIWVDSQIGEGTTFSFALPLAT